MHSFQHAKSSVRLIRATMYAACGRITFAAASVALIGGCAEVKVMRVKADNYDKPGFRYYLPRPYVAVKQPYVVAGDDFFVQGMVDETNNVVLANTAGLPEPIRRRFGGIDPSKPLRIPPSALRSERKTRADGGGARAEAAGEAPKPEVARQLIPAGNDWLKGSSVAPPVLQKSQEVFEVTAVVVKGTPLTEVKEVSVGVVPFKADGGVDEGKFVALPMKTRPDWPGTADVTYVAVGSRSLVSAGGRYAVALAFKGKNAGDTEAKDYLLARTTVDLYVEGTAAEPAGKPQEKEPTKDDVTLTEAGLTIGGDPATSPLQEVNAFFDVLYLPDFDQQYAVEVKAGLGKAGGQVGLENGWMVERASVQLDNRELGRFITKNIEKFIDLGVAALQPAAAVADAVADTAETPGALAEARAQRKPVLLRIRYAAEAQPGLYPILKPSEQKGSPTDPDSEYVLLPTRPYTVVAYNVRHAVSIELVNSSKPPDTRGPSRPGTGADGLGADDIQAWNASLAEKKPKFPSDNAQNHYEVQGVSGDGKKFVVTLRKVGNPPAIAGQFKDDLIDFLLTAEGGYPSSVTIKPKDAGAFTFEMK
jgi:hypothetical protein